MFVTCLGIDLQCFMDMSQHFKETDDVARRSKAMYRMIKLYQNSLSSLEKVLTSYCGSFRYWDQIQLLPLPILFR